MIDLLEFRKYLLDNKSKNFEFKPFGGNYIWFEGFLSRKLKKKIIVPVLNCTFDADWNPYDLPQWAELFNYKVAEYAENKLELDKAAAWIPAIQAGVTVYYPNIPNTVKIKGNHLLKIFAEVFIECDTI